jgi:hypothetical protein
MPGAKGRRRRVHLGSRRPQRGGFAGRWRSSFRGIVTRLDRLLAGFTDLVRRLERIVVRFTGFVIRLDRFVVERTGFVTFFDRFVTCFAGFPFVFDERRPSFEQSRIHSSHSGSDRCS